MSLRTNYDIQHYCLQKLAEASSVEERIQRVVDIFMELFPVKNAYLFRYSPLTELSEGLILMDSTGLQHMRWFRDDVRSMPGIKSSINELTAKYYTKDEYMEQFGNKYNFTASENMFSVIVVPICIGSAVIGYICSNDFEEGALIDHNMLANMTQYGKLAGNFFEGPHHSKTIYNLTHRELDIMRKIANGESLKQMADTLCISEATIKQHVKSVIKKIGAYNRTQAITELVRKGMII